MTTPVSDLGWSSVYEPFDIKYLTEETGCSEEDAKEALTTNNHDIVNALVYISDQNFMDDDSDSWMDIDGDSYMSDSDAPTIEVQIASPSAVVARGVGEQPTCVICMDDFGEQRTSTLKCGHKFCSDCIFENIANAPTNKNMCPLCRQDFCSEISVKEVEQLKDELSALENTLDDNYSEISDLKDAALFFHDHMEDYEGQLMDFAYEQKLWKQEKKSLICALKRTHDKLSCEIIKNDNQSNFKKCNICNQYGHNCGTCVTTKEYYGPSAHVQYKIIHPEKYRPSQEILKDIHEGGYWYSQIESHFKGFNNYDQL